MIKDLAIGVIFFIRFNSNYLLTLQVCKIKYKYIILFNHEFFEKEAEKISAKIRCAISGVSFFHARPNGYKS